MGGASSNQLLLQQRGVRRRQYFTGAVLSSPPAPRLSSSMHRRPCLYRRRLEARWYQTSASAACTAAASRAAGCVRLDRKDRTIQRRQVFPECVNVPDRSTVPAAAQHGDLYAPTHRTTFELYVSRPEDGLLCFTDGAGAAAHCRDPQRNCSAAGSVGGGTIIQAVGKPFDKNCGANAANRIGFLLGDNTYIGGLHFIGSENARYNCLTAPVETPGCANSETRFRQPPNETECGGDTGGTGGHGVQNATVEDITVVRSQAFRHLLVVSAAPC